MGCDALIWRRRGRRGGAGGGGEMGLLLVEGGFVCSLGHDANNLLPNPRLKNICIPFDFPLAIVQALHHHQAGR